MDKKRNINKLISRLNLDCSIKSKGFKERNFHHGHEYVDLGLPSGTLWATCNVGAESETEYGNYYMCGMGSKDYESSDKPYRGTGTELTLPSSVDTAVQVWGGEWHMPTEDQMEELTSKTNYQWVDNYKGSGVNGGLFTSKKNGNSVFLPACGYKYDGQHYNRSGFCLYWSSLISRFDKACCLMLSKQSYMCNVVYRSNGFSIRPVVGFGC